MATKEEEQGKNVVPPLSKQNTQASVGGGPISSSNSAAVAPAAGSDKKPKKKSVDESPTIKYSAERIIGNGSFGVVYQATVAETGETVAIKKVLQDKRFKNRELQIMRMLNHPNVINLKHCFFSHDKPDELYLNLVMQFVPETIYRCSRNHSKAKQQVPIILTKVYMYQMCRSLSYCHQMGICHRDIKPQNLLLDPKAHIVKLCDFGSAKILVKGEPNVAYICSRYYRAPELIFCATDYTCQIDVWSLGCVMAELLIGHPLFPGESGIDQLVEIIKILGTPSREEIYAMNPNYTEFKFPNIKPHPWTKVFRNRVPHSAIDLVSKLLVYKPNDRLSPFEALAHPFFDELREAGCVLPGGVPLPALFNFTPEEVAMCEKYGLTEKLLPPNVLKQLKGAAASPVAPINTSATSSSSGGQATSPKMAAPVSLSGLQQMGDSPSPDHEDDEEGDE